MRRVSAPQLKRELHRAGVCVRFQSSRTLPESRTWNDYFPLSSLCAIFVLIILPELSIVNVNFVTVLFHLCEQGVPCDEEKSRLKYIDQFRGACTAPQKRNPAFAYAGLREIGNLRFSQKFKGFGLDSCCMGVAIYGQDHMARISDAERIFRALLSEALRVPCSESYNMVLLVV